MPGRDLIVFLTFAVILVTLVGQGLTLPWLIRVLRLEDDGGAEREDAKARIKAAEAALARLEELAAEDWVREDTAERMRGQYRFRSNRFRARYEGVDEDGVEERSRSTSGSGASCSTPSAARCSRSATTARSPRR